jgi:hypothetical protein
LKILRRRGAGCFWARFTQPDGRAVPGLRFEPEGKRGDEG